MLPPDAVAKARTWFAEMRKLTQYRSPTDRVCPAEEDFVRLLERELRAPTGMNSPDGFPAGGNGGNRGSSSSTTTEAAALYFEDHEDGRPVRTDIDTIGPLVLAAFDFTDQAGRSAKITREKISEAAKLSKQRLAPGRTVTMCRSLGSHDEPCGEIAVARGRCDACRKWLERHEEVEEIPREVLDNRKAEPRRKYETGPYAEQEAS